MTPLDRLFALEQFGIKLGLDNIRAILAALGHPERAWPSVHIAGTNGKGSVAAMVERGLRAGGLRTGRYTSPHLNTIEERVALDGVPVDRATFETVTAEVLAVMDGLRDAGALTVAPTFFEVSTAIAFEIFRRAKVEAAVVEVGLGGRFDATNVLAPEVSAITSIAFDHERHLGRTLSAIAFEKAGIARRGVPLVVGALPDEATATVASVAADLGAPVVRAHDGVTAREQVDRGRVTLTLTHAGARLSPRPPRPRGAPPGRQRRGGRAHPRDLVGSGLRASGRRHRRRALRVRVARTNRMAAAPGRRHVARSTRRTIPAGAEALAGYLRDAGVAPLPIVFAAMEDKDLAGMVRALAPVTSRFIATTVPHGRARSAEGLAAAIAGHAPTVRRRGGAVARRGRAPRARGGRARGGGRIDLPDRSAARAAAGRRGNAGVGACYSRPSTWWLLPGCGSGSPCSRACASRPCCAPPAAAQIVPGWNTKQFALERIDADRVRLMREVEIEGEPGSPNAGQKFFADDLELNTKTGELTARGNVVFATTTSRISAESVVFNTHTKLGTFANASGIAQLGDKGKARNMSMFGTLEPDVYFYGTSIEKIGPDKYHITSRRLHDVRPAHAALADRQQQRHGQPARLREAHERRHHGEGRPGVLPAGAVLPDPGRRPRHGLPDPDLRGLDLPRAVDQQRLLLGHQPQPGRHALPRLVLLARHGHGRRVPLHAVARLVGEFQGVLARTRRKR